MTVLDFNDVDWHVEASRACDGKVRYGRDTARRVAAERRDQGRPVSAYRCPWCHRYHVGHVPSHESVERIAAAIRNRTNEGEPR